MVIRERIFLPQQFGLKSLINCLLFAFRASASLAAVHYFGTLHLVIPCPWQDVMGCALSVLYYSCHLETPEKMTHRRRSVTTFLWLLGTDIFTAGYYFTYFLSFTFAQHSGLMMTLLWLGYLLKIIQIDKIYNIFVKDWRKVLEKLGQGFFLLPSMEPCKHYKTLMKTTNKDSS